MGCAFHPLISSSILPRYCSNYYTHANTYTHAPTRTNTHTVCKKACIQTHKYTDKPSHTFSSHTLAYRMIMRYKNKEKHFELGIRGDEGRKKSSGNK